VLSASELAPANSERSAKLESLRPDSKDGYQWKIILFVNPLAFSDYDIAISTGLRAERSVASMQAITPLLATPSSRLSLSGKTVLIADDDITILEILEVRCRAIGLRVETSTDGLRTLLKVKREKPDLLILDLNLPDVDGFRVIDRLTDPKFLPLPVIVMTGQSDEACIKRCKELGVPRIQKGADFWAELEPTIYRTFLNTRGNGGGVSEPQHPAVSRTPRILLVDDDPIVLKFLVRSLEKYQVEVIQASSGMQGFWLTLRFQPDLVVTDFNMQEGSGTYLLSRIKSNPSVQHIPVIIFTGETLAEKQVHAIERDLRGRGQAAAFVTKAHDITNLIEQMRRHVLLQGKM
jgi:CheY-like chemotaxis protein